MDFDPWNTAAVRYLFELWVFLLGGAVGSFLNVVVYRLPRGESLLWPPSHCPRCNHPIRWYDNVPILSWMLLAGRCRDCRGPIAVRYPVVEAMCAAMFLVVLLRIGIGAHLPQRPVPVAEGIIFRTRTPLETLGASAYYLVLLATLLAAGLIEHDGHPLPVRVALPALVIGGLIPLVWPQVRPVPAVIPEVGPIGGPGARGALLDAWMGLVDGLAGLGVGLAIGLAAWRLGGRKCLSLVVGPACLGLFLGWQACVPVSLPAILLHGGLRWAKRRWPRWGTFGLERWFPGLALWLGGLAWIVAWERLWGLFSSARKLL